MESLNALESLISSNSVLIFILSIIGLGLAIFAGWIDYRNDRRARDTVSIERRRLSEVNMKIQHTVRILPTRALTPAVSPEPMSPEPTSPVPTSPEGAFVVLRLPMKNIGDGPVDILGLLASSRQLTHRQWAKGIAARSRDLEWSDYEASYWNDENLNGSIFAGNTTTKHLINSADNFLRFASKEFGVIRRIDAVHEVSALRDAKTVNLMYRVFVVARGYPLGEILRQLGGGPPDPAVNVRQELLQFQRLAQPVYQRWLIVQQALININRFAFRLFLLDFDNLNASADPLGVLVDPDAWRMFLLHHWEFVDSIPDVLPAYLREAKFRKYVSLLPPNGMKEAGKIAEAKFPNRRLPDEITEEVKEEIKAAQEKMSAYLTPFKEAWVRLLRAIQDCKGGGFGGHNIPAQCPKENYPRMIHALDEYKARWFALMDEGYLISKPFNRNRLRIGRLRLGGRRKRLDYKDIPDDPRVLEPFVMRTYYYLESIQARELDHPRDAINEEPSDVDE